MSVELLQSLDMIKPCRVLINEEGEAISYERWVNRGAYPDVECVWVRNDGWTLAASFVLAIPARNLWYKEWVGVWNRVANDHGGLFQYKDLTGDNALADLDAWAKDVEALENNP